MPDEKDEQVAARAGPYVAGPTPDEARAKHNPEEKSAKAKPGAAPQTEAVSPDE